WASWCSCSLSSATSGHWTEYERRPDRAARRLGAGRHLPRLRHVQTGVVLMQYFWTIVALVVLLGLAWRFLGSYMAAVFEGRVHWLGWLERPIYWLLATDPEQEQSWTRYAGSLIVFSGVSILFTYTIIRIQGSLPLNPQHLGAVAPALSWNTATSFVTNTNWQNYDGESTMSYFSQMGALTVQQFVSAAVGIVAAIALVRGFARRSSPTI